MFTFELVGHPPNQCIFTLKTTILSIYPEPSYLGKLLTEGLMAAISGRSAEVTKGNIGLIVLCVNPSACVWWVSKSSSQCGQAHLPPPVLLLLLHCIINLGRIQLEPGRWLLLACLLQACHVAWGGNMDKDNHWWCCSGESRAELVLPGVLAWLQSSTWAPPGTLHRPEWDISHSNAGGGCILPAKETPDTPMAHPLHAWEPQQGW